MELITDFPIAVDSPDHMAPHGTANDNNSSPELIQELREYFGKAYSVVDLGCAGGQFTIDAFKAGNLAVGIDGSDYCAKHGKFNWPGYHNSLLFTCDASRPFEFRHSKDGEILKFDCVSSWEFLEHIHPDRIDVLLENITKHMHKDSIFIGQYALTPDVPGSTMACQKAGIPFIELHQCVQTTEWWNAKFAQFFSVSKPYPFQGGVREEGQSIRYFLQL